MNRINAALGLPYKEFKNPSSLVQKTICTRTGLLATSSCPSLTEWFAADTAPSSSCSGHYVEPEPEENFEEDAETTDGSDTDSGSSSGTDSSSGSTGTAPNSGSTDAGNGSTNSNTGADTGVVVTP